MHHYIFCSKDSYITNNSFLFKKNMGLDCFLEIGASAQSEYKARTRIPASVDGGVSYLVVSDFTGAFTGSIFCGTTGSAEGFIRCNCFEDFFLVDDFGEFILTDFSEKMKPY